MQYDAVVIGAGMSGLAAGIRLARLDRRVVVLERHELWGGLNSFYTKEGRAFDVGLHALTNYVPPRTRGAPLTRILRQLRIRHEELHLGEQELSEILLPGLRLTFTNRFEHFEEEVTGAFPAERDGFARLVRDVRAVELDEVDRPETSGRERLAEYVRDPMLREALLLPTFYYGSAREDDIDWTQFVILFRSLFLEGLSRPEGGVRTILNLLVKRLKAEGAELRMRTGARRILVDRGAVRAVELDDGTVLETDAVLSSAGYVETMRLCGPEIERAEVGPADRGRLSFLESISVLDTFPAELGHRAATSFYSTVEEAVYRRPTELADVRSGVISSPNNFHAEKPPKEGMMRITVPADYAGWAALDPEDYAREKERWTDAAISAASAYVPDWRPHRIYHDSFTPRTIHHYTGHSEGAVYGSPKKRKSGETAVRGLSLCGTDQGYLGVVGALVSGLAMGNRVGLASPSDAAPAAAAR